MKKLTLNKTWSECLRMWKWVSAKWSKNKIVYDLKQEWLNSHGYEDSELIDNCFFCDYKRANACGDIYLCKCPAKKVDASFKCQYTPYDWQTNPLAFYRKLVALNKLRLKRKKK